MMIDTIAADIPIMAFYLFKEDNSVKMVCRHKEKESNLKALTVFQKEYSAPESVQAYINSAEHEICPADKYQITKHCNFLLLNTAEHEHFSANKYENTNFCWHFHI